MTPDLRPRRGGVGAPALLRHDENTGDAGSWMMHCHILEHAEAGMMTMIDVTDGKGAPHAR